MQRGLEAAQEMSTQAKKSISPFGRLVDPNAIGAKSAPRVERRMNDTERAQDRMTVFNVLSEVDDAANLLLKQLKESFDPALLTLARTLSERMDGPSTISRDYRVYLMAFKQVYESRRALKRAVAALRAHEEMMNTPDMPMRRPN